MVNLNWLNFFIDLTASVVHHLYIQDHSSAGDWAQNNLVSGYIGAAFPRFHGYVDISFLLIPALPKFIYARISCDFDPLHLRVPRQHDDRNISIRTIIVRADLSGKFDAVNGRHIPIYDDDICWKVLESFIGLFTVFSLINFKNAE